MLRRKTGLMASTIHAAFYKLVDKTNDRMGREKLHFEPAYGRGALADKIVLIDECSMINHALAADIMRTGAKIVACRIQGNWRRSRGYASSVSRTSFWKRSTGRLSNHPSSGRRTRSGTTGCIRMTAISGLSNAA